MADIRIKDLATTASTTASDDFLAVDGTTNGTRKLSAATPSFATSVTVPSVAGPTATDLTLTGGSTGASLVLGQGATAGALAALPTGTGALLVNTSTATNHIRQSQKLAVAVAAAYGGISNTSYNSLGSDVGPIFDFQRSAGATIGTMTAVSSGDTLGFLVWRGSDGAAFQDAAFIKGQADGIVSSGVMPGRLIFSTSAAGSSTPTEAMRLTATRNLLIGGTTDITGSGGLKVFGTTAASSTTSGALQVAGGVGVAGGIYAGAASVFGGTVKIGGEATLSNTSSTQAALDLAGSATSNLVGYTSRTTRSSSSYGAYVRFDSSSLSGGVKYLLQSTGDLDTGGAGSFRLVNDTSGTTLLSVTSTGAATFAGAVTATGSASTTAALRFDNQTGGGGTAQYYANYTAAATTIGRVLRGNGLAGYISNGLNIDNFGGFQIGLNVLGGSGESFKIRNAGTTDLLTITSAGITSLTNTTAGSAGAGALVVSGGLATGAASYFGGAVTVNGAVTTGFGSFSAPALAIGSTDYGVYVAGGQLRFKNSSTGNIVFRNVSDTADSISINPNTSATTFAGAVAIGNTVNTVSPTSPNRTVTMVIGGVTYYLAAKTTND